MSISSGADSNSPTSLSGIVSSSSAIALPSRSSLIAKAFAVSAMKVASSSSVGSQEIAFHDNNCKNEPMQSRATASRAQPNLFLPAPVSVAPGVLAPSDSYSLSSSVPPQHPRSLPIPTPPPPHRFGGALPIDSRQLRRTAGAELDIILNEMQGEDGTSFPLFAYMLCCLFV